jgi:hypothetical protein
MKGIKVVLAVVVGSLLLVRCPVYAETKTFEEYSPLSQCGLVASSAAASVIYFPAKLLYGLTGSLVAGGINLFSLGYAQETATRVGTQAVNGDWIVHPRVITRERCLEFVGSDQPVTAPTLSMAMQQ